MNRHSKNLLLVVYLLVFNICYSYGQVLQFDKKVHDFGFFPRPKSGVTSCEFAFTNSGNAPLVLNKVIASCGCTTPEWTDKPIPPGGKGSIKVTYNATTAGTFNKSITVYSNSKNGTVRLMVKGRVEPYKENIDETYPITISGGIRLNKNAINFQNLSHNESRTIMIDTYNSHLEPVNISFDNVSKEVEVVAVPEKLNPKEKGSIVVSYHGKNNKNWGRQLGTFHVLANNSLPAEKNKVSYNVNLIEDLNKLTQEEKKKAPVLSFSTRNLLFENVKVNTRKKERITLTNTGKETLIIRAINTDTKAMEVKPDKMSILPGKSIKVRITYKPQKEEEITNQMISFITNAPNALNGIVEIEIRNE